MDFNPVFYVNSIIEQAIQDRASDIHIHPEQNKLQVSMRIDGELLKWETLPLESHDGILNRLKVLANLGDAGQQKPQDGRFSFIFNNQKKDLRISIIPALFGKNIVLRILSDKKNIPKLEKLGLTETMLFEVNSLLKLKEGLILSTGPTGSGKTTTMYSLLSNLYNNNPNIHVVCIEDPIEYKFEEFTQVQVNENKNLTFPQILKFVLRHDPDVILIGEIRDEETAKIAVRASLTGHLVFATLHTNDTHSSIIRFLEFGISPLVLADSLKAIFNQRLVKKKCPHCLGKGCPHCNNLGFIGRSADIDLMIINGQKREEIKKTKL